jgi:hypothetical protein
MADELLSEPRLYGDERRNQQLLLALTRIELLLEECVENAERESPSFPQTDLSPLAQQLAEISGRLNLLVPPSPEGIADALARRLPEAPNVSPALEQVANSIARLDKRMKNLASLPALAMPIGELHGEVNINNDASRQLGQVSVTNFPLSMEVANDQGNPVPVSATDLDVRNLSPTQDVVRSLSPIAYYASAAGGRVAYNITTQLVTFTTNGEQPLAALVNPTGSGMDIYLDMGEFGSSLNTAFRRYRNATITATGTPLTGSNTGGGSGTSVARMYTGGAGLAPGSTPTFTRSGGTIAKTAHIAAFQQYKTDIGGRVVLRPGQNLSWTITTTTNVTAANPMTASVFFEYWELPSV